MKYGFPLKRAAAFGIGTIVFLICAIYIARSFQWRAIGEVLAEIRLAWFVLGGGASLVAYWFVRALRWLTVLRSMQVKVRFFDLYMCSTVALSLANYTPFRSGEILKVELLKRYGNVGRLPGYGSFIIERVVDLYVVIAMGIIALSMRFASLSAMNAIYLGMLFVSLPFGACILLHRIRWGGRIGTLVRQVQDGIGSLRTLSKVLALTVLSWILVAIGWCASLESLSISLSLTEVLGLLSGLTLASLASFIPGGIGVVEAGASGFLELVGISPERAQAGAIVLRCLSLYGVGLGLLQLLYSGMKLTDAPDAGDPIT